MTSKQPSNQESASSPLGNDAPPSIKTAIIVNHIDASEHHDMFQALLEPSASHQAPTRQPIGKNNYVDHEQFIAQTCTDVYRVLSGGNSRLVNHLD